MSDNKPGHVSSTDFVVRSYFPNRFHIALAFFLFFLSLELTIILAFNHFSFTLVNMLVAVMMCTATIYAIQRSRDQLLVTEFENALFASGLTMHHQFTLILNRDGLIVYMDRGFRDTFPGAGRMKHMAIDSMLEAGKVTRPDAERIFSALAKRSYDKVMFSLMDKEGHLQKILMSIEPLTRPGGFVLMRGREYIEQREGREPEAAAADLSSPLVPHIMNKLPVGVYGINAQGGLEFANAKLEELLGYGPEDLLQQNRRLEDLVHHSGLRFGLGNFEGEVLLRGKNGAPVRAYITQDQMIDASGRSGGCTAMVYPLSEHEEIKKKDFSRDSAHALKFDSFIETSPIAIAKIDARGFIVEANDTFQRLTQNTLRERIPYRLLDLVHAARRDETDAILRNALSGNLARQPHALEFVLPNGSAVMVSLYFSHVDTQDGNRQLLAHLIDTTEQKNLEMRFTHSQKMQAVGQLAGGVAHDFNNLLTAMIGFCDLLLMRHPAGDQSFADIMQIKQNANRAANLVRQLLAFSRRQTLQPKLLDPTDVLAELSNLVRRLIGENIELKMNHGRDMGHIKADQGQLEQVIINLAVNARDAMPSGGTLTIQTSKAVINRKNPLPKDLVAPSEEDTIMPDGEYVLVEVIDSGTGIPTDLLQKIFEPFFSTKEVGSGTGLGLATVYGIIKQTGGHIFVASSEGSFTRFAMYFPSHQSSGVKLPSEAENIERAASVDLTGKGTVLLVEDETPVRLFAARALRNKGYTVLEADCGETALEVMKEHGSEVEVIITDAIMPGMNGPTMIEKLLPNYPNIKVIFISGYAEDAFLKSYGTERSFNFLPKPFTLKQLASKVKEVASGK